MTNSAEFDGIEQAAPGSAARREQGSIAALMDSARSEGRPDGFVGKRRWRRYAVGIEMEAAAIGADGAVGPTRLVRVHNMSGGGIGFWSSERFDAGSIIQLRAPAEAEPLQQPQPDETPQPFRTTSTGRNQEACENDWIRARVMHCAVALDGFLVGVGYECPTSPDAEWDVDRDGGRRSGFPHGPWHPRSLSFKCAIAMGAVAGLAAALGFRIATASSSGALLTHVQITGVCVVIGMVVGALIVHYELRFIHALWGRIRELARGGMSTRTLPAVPSIELGALHRAFYDLNKRWRHREHEERLQRQKLEEVTRIKSNILAIVSHDLRTPLTSILLYARMLEEELETLEVEDRKRFLSIIGEECERLSGLLDDLLEVQRLEMGKSKWNMRSQDLASVVKNCKEVFDVLARSKNITLTADCPESLPQVEADAGKLSQVLSNLLSNALKYTGAGGAVEVSAHVRASEVLLRVADNGPGIPRDKWEFIFDRFSQLSDANIGDIAGFGLGLNIVRRIVEGHGGRVWCDSEMGQGTEFFVALPILQDTEPETTVASDNQPSLRLVVCDADPELAAMMAHTLRQQGWEVRVVHSACRLLTLLDQHEVDAVITDVLLPDMKAQDLLDSLTQARERTYKLIVHSYAGAGHQQWGYGVDVFLRRPVSQQELVMAVRTALQRGTLGGLTVMALPAEALDLGRLNHELSAAGHQMLVAESFEAAVTMSKTYATDVIVVHAGRLSHDWHELGALTEMAGAPPVLVLCRTLPRRARRLAEKHGVAAVLHRAGAEASLVPTITEMEYLCMEECAA